MDMYDVSGHVGLWNASLFNDHFKKIVTHQIQNTFVFLKNIERQPNNFVVFLAQNLRTGEFNKTFLKKLKKTSKVIGGAVPSSTVVIMYFLQLFQNLSRFQSKYA